MKKNTRARVIAPLMDFVLCGIKSELLENEDKYKFEFNLMDLNGFETHKIVEFVDRDKLKYAVIEGNLAKIFIENNIPDDLDSYKYLVDPQRVQVPDDILTDIWVPLSEKQFIFSGYQLKNPIIRFEDIIVIPNPQRQITRVLLKIFDKM